MSVLDRRLAEVSRRANEYASMANRFERRELGLAEVGHGSNHSDLAIEYQRYAKKAAAHVTKLLEIKALLRMH
jgi:hypothetical protein